MKTSALDLRLPKAGVFVRAGHEALALGRNPAALSFFVPQIVFLGFVVAAFASFHRAPQSVLLAPFVERVAGPRALHYPDLFERLPWIVSVAEAACAGAFFAFGWAAFLRATPAFFSGRRPDVKSCWRAARDRGARVAGVAIPLAALHLGALLQFEALRAGELGESPRLLQFAEAASFGVVLLARVLSAYALPAILLSDLGLGAAFARSWATATRNRWTTAAFVSIPRVAEVPLREVTARLPDWYASVNPEASVGLVLARTVVTTLGTGATLAALARLYLHLYGSEREA